MFKKITFSFLFIVSLLLVAFPNSSLAKSFTIDSVVIHTYILPNGDFYVEELYTYTFEGSYNGTTRTIGEDGHEGIQFFEAYSVPDDAKLGELTSDITEPLRVSKDGNTFKIYRAAENETIKVYYRYRIQGAIRKYEDVGEFYWRFFDSLGDSDLHNLEIHIGLYDTQENKPVHAVTHGFMHEIVGGTYEVSEKGLIYHNEIVPKGELVELRLLFPSDFLREMDYTKHEPMLSTILEEEEEYQERLNRRNELLPILEKINMYIFLALFFFSLYAIIFPKRLFRLFGRRLDNKVLEKMDSFTLTGLYRLLRFVPHDLNAVLFRLYQQGYLKMERIPLNVPKDDFEEVISDDEEEEEYEVFEDDEDSDEFSNPEYTFKFTLETTPSPITEHEKFLLDWLFTSWENGKRIFTLDQLPSYYRASYKEEKKSFKENYRIWRKLARNDEEVLKYVRPLRLRILFDYGIIPLWLLWACYQLWIGMGERIDVFFGYVFCLIFALVTIVSKRKRRKTAIFAFLMIAFFNEFGLDRGFEYLAITPFLLFFIATFLPEIYPTYQGIPYYRSIKRWLKDVKAGELKLAKNMKDLERQYQHAIALDHAYYFSIFYHEKIANLKTDELYPLLLSPKETTKVYHYHYPSYYTVSYNMTSSSSGGSSSSSSSGSAGGGGAGAF